MQGNGRISPRQSRSSMQLVASTCSAHPDPLPDWHFSQAFPAFPNRYRRSVIKDVIGKARGYLTTLAILKRGGPMTPGKRKVPN
jgi:hypothetical protein